MKNNIKKGLAFFIILLFLGLAVIPITDTKIINIENEVISFHDNSEVWVDYIDACSAYDYGWKAGRQFHLQYKIIDLLIRFIKKDYIDQMVVENQIKTMEKYCPFLLEELRGLSDSTKIKLERLVTLQMTIHSLLETACTAYACTGNATKNNETFLAVDSDSPFNNTEKILLVFIIRIINHRCLRIARKGYAKYDYAYWGGPVIGEVPLLNEKGLGVLHTSTTRTKNTSRVIDEGPGFSPNLLKILSLMECKNVSEVAQLWKEMERGSNNNKEIPYSYMNTIWGDSEGGILVIEQSHSYIKTVFGNSTDITNASEGILWHANHHKWLNPNLTGSIYQGEEGVTSSSFMRDDRVHELLEANYGNITLDVCKKICRDHGGGTNKYGRDSADLCMHPDKNRSSITICSWIIVPKDLTLYLSVRAPCRSIYRKHDFNKIFNRNN